MFSVFISLPADASSDKSQQVMLPPAEVMSDIGLEMNNLKDEIENLKNTIPPKNYTVEHILTWLQALKNSPDNKAIHILIKRIDIKNKTAVNIQSTIDSVLCETGCGGRI